MISALTGQLIEVEANKVQLRAGPMVFEILVPVADLDSLRPLIGQEITFHTIFYLEGTAGGGNLDPRLIGFQTADDRRFFELFTTVKGIGPKTALKALSLPVGEIAHAIEARDARFLIRLDGIGKRTAELIIAELCGKVQDFALAAVGVATGHPAGGPARRTGPEEDAIAAMTALGERRPDAERLLERVRQAYPNLSSTDALLREMLRIRGSRG